MSKLIAKAKGLHSGQGGFTLIELMVVLVIIALLVGLVVPNFFDLTEDTEAVMVQGQHEKMREAVYSYFTDTGEWPTEWSEYALNSTDTNRAGHQLWDSWDDCGNATLTGWEGPYIDRPILQETRWDGYWGVVEDRQLNMTSSNNTGAPYYTALCYQDVPQSVASTVDSDMDDGERGTGAVQYGGTTWPSGNSTGGGNATSSGNYLEIILGAQDGESGGDNVAAP
ncbi:MAG: type II secretion system protein [Dehalococcoidia bacterium]